MRILISPFRDCMKFSNSTWTKAIPLFAGFAAIVSSVFGQSDLGSPYSLFGPGLPSMRQTVTQAGMGGTGVAFSDPYRLNLINPAAAAGHLEPIFEMSGLGSVSTFQSNSGSFENQSFTINNIGMAYPIKRGVWNLNLGLVPLTAKNYDFTSSEQTEQLGAFRSEYSGNGGISQAYLGTAYKVYNKIDTANNVTALSLGVQGNFNFGPVNNLRRISFPDDPGAMGLSVRESFLVRSPSIEAGVQYQTNLIKRTMKRPRYLKLLVGAVYRFESSLSAERSNYVYNWRPTPAGNESPRDTIFASTGAKGSLNMPATAIFGIGLDYVTDKRQRIRFGLDYSVKGWSDYSENFDDEVRTFDFRNSEKVSAGIEFTPNLGGQKMVERLEYRLGFRSVRTGLVVSGTAINDYGISFGLSLPVNFRRNLSQSRFSVSAEYGSYGTVENGLIREDYVRIMAGFSLTPHFRNRWFVKPKYD